MRLEYNNLALYIYPKALSEIYQAGWNLWYEAWGKFDHLNVEIPETTDSEVVSSV